MGRSRDDDPGYYSAYALSEEYGIEVLGPSGWWVRNLAFDTFLTHREFHLLASESTYQIVDFVKFKAFFFMEPLPRSIESNT